MKFLLRHILFRLITLSCFLSTVNLTSLKIYSLFVLEVNGVCLRGCLNFLSGSTGLIALTTLVVILFAPALGNIAPFFFFFSKKMEGKEKVGRREIWIVYLLFTPQLGLGVEHITEVCTLDQELNQRLFRP